MGCSGTAARRSLIGLDSEVRETRQGIVLFLVVARKEDELRKCCGEMEVAMKAEC